MLFPLFDRNPHKRLPIITLLLIAANVFFFWRSIENGPAGFADTVYEHGFVPLRLTELDEGEPVNIKVEMQDAQGNPGVFRKQLSTKTADVYPTLVTMMFLHGGWLHLISNMWMLWVFGNNVEDRLGHIVFSLFYLVGGLLAVLTHWGIDPQSTQPVIGASGAVAAVLGAYAVTYPNAQVKTLIFVGIPWFMDLPSWLVLGAWFLLQTIAGIQGLGAPADVEASVAFWAHIGGFVAGMILMPCLTIGAQPPDEDWKSESREMFEF